MITVDFIDYEDMLAFAKKLVGNRPVAEMEVKAEKKATPVKVEQAATKAPVVKEETPEETPDSQVKEEPAVSDDVAGHYRLEDVRAKLAELNRAGKRAQVKELLAGFGAEKLTGVPVEKYGELMAKVGEL